LCNGGGCANHVLPSHPLVLCRYGIDLDLKEVAKTNALEKGQRVKTRGLVRKAFQARYNTGKNKWFFTKLRF